MPVRELPENPSLEHLKNEAKSLQRRVRAAERTALDVVREFHPRLADLSPADAGTFARSDAQLVVARRYGFASWARLRSYLALVLEHTRAPHREPIGGPLDSTEQRAVEFLRLACLVYGGDSLARHVAARRMLDEHPEIARADIFTISAVGDVAAARAALSAEPALARVAGGPFNLEPIVYLAYSRLDSTAPGHSTLEVARLLLANGADPNAGYLWHGLYPFTALTGAFGEGEDAVNQPRHQYGAALARLLLEAGADPNDSQTLYNRMFRSDNDHLELLFEFGLGVPAGGPWYARFGPSLPTVTGALEDQLVWAVRHDMPARVELLLSHGVDPNTRDGDVTAYQLATQQGSPEIAGLLVRAGAEVGELDPVQRFIAAAMSGDHDAVAALVVADPGLAEQARQAEPDAIVRAAELGRLEAVRLLAEHGFDVNIRPRTTALHEAAVHGNLEMLQLLLSLGADPDQLDTEFDATPLGWAEHNQQQHIVEYLTRLGAGGSAD